MKSVIMSFSLFLFQTNALGVQLMRPGDPLPERVYPNHYATRPFLNPLPSSPQIRPPTPQKQPGDNRLTTISGTGSSFTENEPPQYPSHPSLDAATIGTPVIMGAREEVPLLPEFEYQEAIPVSFDQDDKFLRWNPCNDVFPRGCEMSILHGNLGRPETDSYVRVPKNYLFPPHSQSTTTHIIILSGRLKMKYLNEKEITLKPGSFLYLPPNLPRKSRCVSQGGCLFFVHFDKPPITTPFSGKI